MKYIYIYMIIDISFFTVKLNLHTVIYTAHPAIVINILSL